MRTIATALVALGALIAFPAQAQVTLVNPKDAAKAKRSKASSKSSRDRAPGQVLISVKDADLRTEVLPLFKEQAGVNIRWQGAPRKVSLRLIEPVDWEEALALVARFSNTHVANHRGRIFLKDKWGGAPDDTLVFDDLDGQVKTPDRLKRTSLQASARRGKRIPVVRPRKVIPVVKLGGGTLDFRPRGPQPRPNVNNRGMRPRKQPGNNRGQQPRRPQPTF